jgi:putative NADPH-quinone reductase
MKNILIINGHPNPHSFCYALANAYYKGASETSTQVKLVHLTHLQFDPVLQFGYEKKMELEPDLIEIQKDIEAADHLVFIYPNWWGTMPALLKGFFDRVFTPGFAFKYSDKSKFPEKLLKGRSARVVVTMDTPPWFNSLFFRSLGHRVTRNRILEFCGIKVKGIMSLGPVKGSTLESRQKWLAQVELLGRNLK